MSDTKQKFIDAVVKGIAELPDRSSPEGHPELMQCTAEEVVDVLLVVYREHIAALEADAARLKYIAQYLVDYEGEPGDADCALLDAKTPHEFIKALDAAMQAKP